MKSIFKKIVTVGMMAIAMVVVSSCDSDYLETDPTDAVSVELATSTVDNLSNIVNGMHRDMYTRQSNGTSSTQGKHGGIAISIYLDAMGDDLVFPSSASSWFLGSVRWETPADATDMYTRYPYRFYYKEIANANQIIENADEATGDAEVKDRVLGEAHAFRAYAYYMLVQMYAKRYVKGENNSQLGMPLRTDTEFDPIPRNTVEETYTLINDDLTTALSLLEGKKRANKSHFDENVVYGLLARVALTQGRWADAATYAHEARQGYPLMSNAEYLDGFNDYNNQEWLWGYHYTLDQRDNFANWMSNMSRNFDATAIRNVPKAMNSALFDLFPSSDVRTQTVRPDGQHPELNLASNYSLYPYTSQKFLTTDWDNSLSLGDAVMMRSAEMYLIEAEALARNGQEGPSKEVFNEFMKNRDPAYTSASTSGDAYIEDIMNSRRIELWGEGQRFLDLKRLNLPLDRSGANHNETVTNGVMYVEPSDKRWQYLIPQDEINNSKGVVEQNEL